MASGNTSALRGKLISVAPSKPLKNYVSLARDLGPKFMLHLVIGGNRSGMTENVLREKMVFQSRMQLPIRPIIPQCRGLRGL